MIAAVYRDMTVQTCAIKGAAIHGSIDRFATLVGLPRVKVTVMRRVAVTTLAQVRHLAVEKRGAGRPVRGMAGQAVFNYRRVLPQIRPSFFSMAFVTFQIDCAVVNEVVFDRAVRIVAVGAGHFSIADRMARLAQQLRPYLLVAGGTEFSLVGLAEAVRIVLMNAVAAGTRKIPLLVIAAVPVDELVFCVTGKAGGVYRFTVSWRIGFEGNDVTLALTCYMSRAWPVARFTTIGSGRSAAIPGNTVGIALKRSANVVVAFNAGRCTGIAFCCFARRYADPVRYK